MLTEIFQLASGSALLADTSDIFIALPAMVLVFGIPIVAILTHHQRKMAELMRQQPQVDVNLARQLDAMQAQINELRGLVQDNIIRNDAPPATLPQTPPSIENRLNG